MEGESFIYMRSVHRAYLLGCPCGCPKRAPAGDPPVHEDQVQIGIVDASVGVEG